MENNCVEIEGFRCYAPEVALQNEGFPPDMFDILATLEENNFWFKSRNKIIVHLFQKYLSSKNKKVLEIGCGNGYVLSALKNAGYQVIGSEIYLDGLKNTKRRISDVELIQMDALKMPFNDELDAIGAFDVIEHIDNDIGVMKNAYNALKKNGCFFITVPQYKWMWSYLDDYAKHKRRYTQKEMSNKLQSVGFKVTFISSFVTILFPFVCLSRMIKKNKKAEELTMDDVIQEFKIPLWMNKLFYKLILIDTWLIKKGISLSFGNSIVVVAKK